MYPEKVILLDQSFNFIDYISIKKCVKLIVKSKVEVIKTSTKELHHGFYLPTTIRLLKSINIKLSKKIPFSKQNIFIRDECICAYCGEVLTPRTATVDHIHPVSRGGKNTFSNCITSCRKCNQYKNNSLLKEINLSLLYIPLHPTYLQFSYCRAKSLGIDVKRILSE